MNRRQFSRLLAGATALLTLGLTGVVSVPAFAHEAKCPLCKLDVVQDTDEQDNEVAIKYGRKRIEYRCVYCAINQAETEFKGDLTVLAPSEVKGKPVVLSRKDGKWSAKPEKAVFVAVKLSHRHCQIGYRAFTTNEAFEKWVKKNEDKLKDAKPLNLDELVKISTAKADDTQKPAEKAKPAEETPKSGKEAHQHDGH